MTRNMCVMKLDDDLYERLQQRAAKEGVSMEEEVRRILSRALNAPSRLGSLAAGCYKDLDSEVELPERVAHSPITLD